MSRKLSSSGDPLRLLSELASRLRTVALMSGLHSKAGTWMRCVDRFVIPSNFARQKYIQAGWPAAKLVVKFNTVAEPTLANRYDCRRRFLCLARLAYAKGVDVLLKRVGCGIPRRRRRVDHCGIWRRRDEDTRGGRGPTGGNGRRPGLARRSNDAPQASQGACRSFAVVRSLPASCCGSLFSWWILSMMV